MTRNIRIDLQLSLTDIEAELPDMSGELPAYQIGQRALKGAIDNALNLKPHVWPFGRCLVRGHEVGSPMQVFISPMMTAAPVCMRAPLTPGGEEAGSRVNGFR
jgi:hypothetical protein